MKNYRAWVKQEGQRFVEAALAEFEADPGVHGGASGQPDFLAWVEEHDRVVKYATAVGEKWGLGDVAFVNSNSPNRDEQAVSKRQAIDAFVRDLSRTIKQLWKKR
ncbi:MAG: hypothetical protein JXQ29_00725 [Planctomycetes bacterium]|nr:hypothetical protein [Planctomycetota bacterium]